MSLLSTQDRHQLRCFNCGEKGHSNKNKDCPNPKSPKGDEAWAVYKRWRRTDAKNYIPLKLDRDYTKIFAQWMSQTTTPSDVLKIALNRKTKNSVHDFTCAYRIFFMKRLEKVTESLDEHIYTQHVHIGSTSAEQAKAVEQLNKNLNLAVKEGAPPTFVDADANIVYARDRLPTRVRYMYAAIMNDLAVSSVVRGMFVPSVKSTKIVKIASIGSGPANDYVAYSLLRDFMYESQSTEVQKPTLECTNYDLFADDWAPIVNTVVSAVQSNCPNNDTIDDQFMDLRAPISHPTNRNLEANVNSFDIFCFTFVLHENRSFLECRDSQNNVTGVDNCLLGILEAAKVGSVIIALDAGERLFPTLLDHARRLGWDGECPKRKWKMGCKSVCMLEKKTGGFGGRKSSFRGSGFENLLRAAPRKMQAPPAESMDAGAKLELAKVEEDKINRSKDQFDFRSGFQVPESYRDDSSENENEQNENKEKVKVNDETLAAATLATFNTSNTMLERVISLKNDNSSAVDDDKDDWD